MRADEGGDVLSVKGDIQQGDYTNLLRVVKAHGRMPARIEISSPGGDVMEAMRIGRFVRKGLMTFAASTECSSAAVLIYLATVRRWTNPTFTFGIHRPFYSKDYFANLGAQEAETLYNKMRAEVDAYLRDMEVPKAFIELMYSVSSDTLREISYADLQPMIYISPPSYDEWRISLKSKCSPALTERETEDAAELFYHTLQRYPAEWDAARIERYEQALARRYSPGYAEYLHKKHETHCAEMNRLIEEERQKAFTASFGK